MKKLIFLPLFLLVLVSCSEIQKNYSCKYEDSDSIVSVSIKGNSLVMSTSYYNYCENSGNWKIYHRDCKKNEFGNYESSIWFDPIVLKIRELGSGGLYPVNFYSCREVR